MVNHFAAPVMIEPAVSVQCAVKGYGAGEKRAEILKSLDMTVRKGTIYGLLGASGCGKTTLLSCIVGRRHFDSGEVYVFGGVPGTKESGIPGRRVGYMPQELALYGEFTIQETLFFFGRIYKLPSNFIKAQMEFLCDLLALPPASRYVKSLSGGQQRRVSFAVALFHDPELLILDEPTVGVDPLISKKIWDHLVRLSSDYGRTVIITTHYIEEAKQSHTIGLMRSGKLLAQDSPQNLLSTYSLDSLEDVFLQLCMKDGVVAKTVQPRPCDFEQPGCSHDDVDYQPEKKPRNKIPILSSSYRTESTASILSSSANSTEETNSPYPWDYRKSIEVKKRPSSSTSKFSLPSPARTWALIRKNVTQTFRNFGMFLFIFLLPAAQSIVFCVGIGHEPHELKLAVINDELIDPVSQQHTLPCQYLTDCTYSMFSCRLLRYLDNETIVQVPYTNLEKAMEAARQGIVWGVVHFPQNFTDELVVRQSDGKFADFETIIGSQVNVSLDWSNNQIAFSLQRTLLEATEDFSRDIATACSYQPDVANLPVSFLDPIYGNKDPSFTDFMAPGLIITIVYFIATTLTAAIFVSEQKQGLIDRCLVAGVQMTEVLVAHVANQFTILVGQTGLVFFVMLVVFKIPCVGSLPLAVFISLMQGLCGMSFGLLVSVLCTEESSALHLSLGSFYPNILLSGVLWPMEGMWIYLRYAAYYMPQTYAVEALRHVFLRGWGIERQEVYQGIIASGMWIGIWLVVGIAVIRSRKYTG